MNIDACCMLCNARMPSKMDAPISTLQPFFMTAELNRLLAVSMHVHTHHDGPTHHTITLYIRLQIFTCKHTSTHVYLHTHMHARTHTCTQIHTHTYTYIHTHAHSYTHTYIHTHIHTHTQGRILILEQKTDHQTARAGMVLRMNLCVLTLQLISSDRLQEQVTRLTQQLVCTFSAHVVIRQNCTN